VKVILANDERNNSSETSEPEEDMLSTEDL
jgi:hypothetical protein